MLGCPQPANTGKQDSGDYTMTYDGNGSTSGAVPVDTRLYNSGEAVAVPENTGKLQKKGYTFTGWTTEAGGKGMFQNVDTTFNMGNGNMVLYACWIPNYRVFKAIDASVQPYASYDCQAELLEFGRTCLVYAEIEANIAYETGKKVALEFDTKIYNQVRNTFGKEVDYDSNGRVIILLLDVKDGYTDTSGTYAVGYFNADNQFGVETKPESNEAEIIYIDTNPSEVDSSFFYASIAHEFQHLVNWSQTYPVIGAEQDTWITEGLSSAAEYLYSKGHIQWKVDYFNSDPGGTIRRGNNFFVWNDPLKEGQGVLDGDVLANYASVYLFFQWLRIHADNGNGIFREIVESSFSDYRAVTTAAGRNISTKFNNWQYLLSSWMLANILGQDSGWKGYKNSVGVEMGMFEDSSPEGYLLAPGEGVYSLRSASLTDVPAGSGQHVRYIGIDSVSGRDFRSQPFGGDLALVYNANTDIGGDSETGFVAGGGSRGSLSSLRSSVVPISPVGGSFPVDLTVRLRESD